MRRLPVLLFLVVPTSTFASSALGSLGACCLDNGNCLVLSESDCGLISDSSWKGPLTGCGDNNGDGLPDACFPPPPFFGPCFLDTIPAVDPTDVSFGRSVAVLDDWILIGDPLDDEATNNAGAAYVFRRLGSEWVQEAKLIASNPTADSQFGIAVSLTGDMAAIGARLEGQGKVYVFRRTGLAWSEEAQLTTEDQVFNMGCTVAARGNFVAATSSNGLYVFERHPSFGWIFQQHADATPGCQPLAMTGSRIALAGRIYRQDHTDVNGHTFWSLETVLAPSDGAIGFGNAAAISGDVIVIGAETDNTIGPNGGSAYVYRRVNGSWTEEAKLFPNDWAAFQLFGSAVATDGNVIAVGQRQDGGPGAIYFFQQAGDVWAQQLKLFPPEPPMNVDFGTGLALDNGFLAVADYSAASVGPDAGAVYVLAVVGPDCNGNASLDACDISVGTSRDIDLNLIPDECLAPIPAVSAWGIAVLMLAVAVAATIILARRAL